MATWGSQTWGYEKWGTLGDVTLTVSGQSTTASVNSITVDAQIQIGWGGLAWGEGEWGDLANPNIDVSGNSLTSTVNSVSVAIGVDALLTSVSLNTTTGVPFVTAPVEIDLTGIELTATSSAVSLESKYLIGSAEATTAVVSVTTQANADVIPTGVGLTGSTGQLEYEAAYSFNGSEANSTAGDVFGGEAVDIQVTTASTQPWGELTWGDGEWGQSVGTDIAIGADAVLTPSVEVDVTGVQLNWTIGTENVTADANLTLSGVSAEVFQGDENAFTEITIEATGQQLTTQLSSVVAGISQLVTPTGVTATVSSGTMGVNAWAVVQPNASTTWSVVDKAAA